MKLLIKQRVFSWTDSYDIYDEYERYEEKRSSTNFSVAVFDLDSNILYYYIKGEGNE